MITFEAVEARFRLRRVPARWQGEPPAAFDRLTADSRLTGSGDLFVAVAGLRSDGHSFLRDAARAGAAAAVVERPADLDIPQLVVPDTRVALADLAMLWEGDPAAGHLHAPRRPGAVGRADQRDRPGGQSPSAADDQRPRRRPDPHAPEAPGGIGV